MTLAERLAAINAEHGWPSAEPDPEIRAIIDRDLAHNETLVTPAQRRHGTTSFRADGTPRKRTPKPKLVKPPPLAHMKSRIPPWEP